MAQSRSGGRVGGGRGGTHCPSPLLSGAPVPFPAPNGLVARNPSPRAVETDCTSPLRVPVATGGDDGVLAGCGARKPASHFSPRPWPPVDHWPATDTARPSALPQETQKNDRLGRVGRVGKEVGCSSPAPAVEQPAPDLTLGRVPRSLTLRFLSPLHAKGWV
ncbi:hypothetical protein VTK73DRAFT_2572 [Phialemonium thermophilum]|uniref:Uncharacterized protein n=1 Tax=Phialemonium thermophilum TaxID=223376 RepID=A0ABR3VRY5_9PEZI